MFPVFIFWPSCNDVVVVGMAVKWPIVRLILRNSKEDEDGREADCLARMLWMEGMCCLWVFCVFERASFESLSCCQRTTHIYINTIYNKREILVFIVSFMHTESRFGFMG